MHLLSNTNSNPDELCGHLCYDLCGSNSMTVNHGDCVGTFINIAHSFQQICLSNEWLDMKDGKSFGNSFKFHCLIAENYDNIKNCPLRTTEDFVKFDFYPNSLCVQVDGHNCGLGSIVSCMRLVDVLVSTELDKKWTDEQENTN